MSWWNIELSTVLSSGTFLSLTANHQFSPVTSDAVASSAEDGVENREELLSCFYLAMFKPKSLHLGSGG